MPVVYTLKSYEYNRYRDHLLALDAESRYLRFGFPIKDETIYTLAEQWAASPADHKIFVVEDDDLNVIAAGHVSKVSKPVEIALSVLKEHQGQGLGSLLMETCVNWCRNRSIESGFMVCLPSNTAVRKIASKYGLIESDRDEATAMLKIPGANFNSVFNEYMYTNMSNLDHLGKAQRKILNSFKLPLKFD